MKKYLIMCIMRVWVYNIIMTAMCTQRFGRGESEHLRQKPLQRPAV